MDILLLSKIESKIWNFLAKINNYIKTKINNNKMPEQMSEEQMKALQEKIKQMSPEELKEFQKKQCIFCQMVAGKVASKKVYEDDRAIAILDINPANPGHMLLFPKEHYTIMPQMPDEEINHVFMVTKALSNALLKGIGSQGTNVIVANGVAAGQRAQHFMIHIIPRMDKDDLHFTLPQNTIPENELEKIRKKLSKGLGEVKGEKSKALPKFEMPEKKVVEAEFKEQPIKKNLIKKEPIKTKPKKSTKKEEVDLDDIAKVLGAK